MVKIQELVQFRWSTQHLIARTPSACLLFSTFKAGIQLFGGRPSPVSFQDLLMRASNGVLNPSVCNEALNITTSNTSKDDACIQRKDVQILSIQFVATEMLE